LMVEDKPRKEHLVVLKLKQKRENIGIPKLTKEKLTKENLTKENTKN